MTAETSLITDLIASGYYSRHWPLYEEIAKPHSEGVPPATSSDPDDSYNGAGTYDVRLPDGQMTQGHPHAATMESGGRIGWVVQNSEGRQVFKGPEEIAAWSLREENKSEDEQVRVALRKQSRHWALFQPHDEGLPPTTSSNPDAPYDNAGPYDVRLLDGRIIQARPYATTRENGGRSGWLMSLPNVGQMFTDTSFVTAWKVHEEPSVSTKPQ
jgi:hypothetical protein